MGDNVIFELGETYYRLRPSGDPDLLATYTITHIGSDSVVALKKDYKGTQDILLKKVNRKKYVKASDMTDIKFIAKGIEQAYSQLLTSIEDLLSKYPKYKYTLIVPNLDDIVANISKKVGGAMFPLKIDGETTLPKYIGQVGSCKVSTHEAYYEKLSIKAGDKFYVYSLGESKLLSRSLFLLSTQYASYTIEEFTAVSNLQVSALYLNKSNVASRNNKYTYWEVQDLTSSEIFQVALNETGCTTKGIHHSDLGIKLIKEIAGCFDEPI